MLINKIKEITLENIAIMPLQIKLAILLFFSLIIFWLGYNWLLANDLERLITVKTSLEQLKHTIQIKNRKADNMMTFKTQLQRTMTDFAAKLAYVNADKSEDNLVDDITKIGVANELRFKSIKSSNEQQIDAWATQSIQIVLAGNYQQLMRFLNQTGALKQLLVWSDFNIEKEDSNPLIEATNNDRLIMTLVIQVYRYLDQVISPLSIKVKTNNRNKTFLIGRNIFIPKSSLGPDDQLAEPLTGFPLSALHVVGIIAQENKSWALILTPIDKIYWANIGSRVGQHNGKVTAIGKNYLDVSEIKNKEQSTEQLRLILGK